MARYFRDEAEGVEYEQSVSHRNLWFVERGNNRFTVTMDVEHPTAQDVIKKAKENFKYAWVTGITAVPQRRAKDRPKSCLEMAEEFHRAFGHPVNDRPKLDDEKLNALRLNLLAEELTELHDALYYENVTEVLDALCDLQYVLDGAWLAFGFSSVKQEAMEETHRGNMSKLGFDGKPIYRDDGKVLKGLNYLPPDHSKSVIKLTGSA